MWVATDGAVEEVVVALPADAARVRVDSVRVSELHPELASEGAIVAYLNFDPLEVDCGSAEHATPPDVALARQQRSPDPRDQAGVAAPSKLAVWEEAPVLLDRSTA